jgi:Integrase zinc binding domain
VISQDLKVCELLYNLAHDTLGHFGFDKSYESLHDSYYWSNMCWDAYIPSCTKCQQNKNQTSKPTGPLHPLPVPDDWFDTVVLDFIGPLPEENGKDTILTMTDLLGADICIASIHSSYTAAQVAIMFFDEWYCENGLIVSDRDACFTTKLWTALHKLTSIKLKMLTSYHPETDGSSEQTNKTMNQAIWNHVDNNQKGWASQTPPCMVCHHEHYECIHRFLWFPTQNWPISMYHPSYSATHQKCHC